ncbi:MAG TPA: aldo/keto reductase [Anaerolineae bacterium]|nr:aldo/keto reductase [Anaerolineae bacterium]
MKFRELGISGLKASVVALGAWAIGGWMWGKTDKQAAIKAIQISIEHGINLIDTAPAYGFGNSEKIVGEAIRGRRDKVILATKLGLVWHIQQGKFFFASNEKGPSDDGELKIYKYLSPKSIRYEIENSLRRLGVETIDLYQTHWQDPTTPIVDSMAELLKLKEEGKIRAIGVCNVTLEQLKEYRKVGIVDADQEKYSMLDREHEADLLPFCQKNKIAFLAYSPLAHGLLTGKISPERKYDEGDQRLSNKRYKPEALNTVKQMLDEFNPISEEHSVSIAQLVIAWTYHQPGCSHVLVGARKPQHAAENALAGDIHLSNAELTIISKIIEKYEGKIPSKK